ncbi:19578_t:CDS:2 [Dentiscutata erythropus]|uniref:19578_t:CDS:1 n=1 Tax=Dentiscutata erythropus TaxID=1348616 RepID=A0A9N9CIA2_9GLOM|nr:19578_t:CDS:2 [Dentiscutata erythropus]
MFAQEEVLEGTFLQRLFKLIEILSETRNDTIKRVEKTQESAKIRHDHNLPTIEEIKRGDQVLVYEAF